jgi:hypothetical protein
LVPAANDEDVIASVLGATTIEVATDFVCTGLPLSLTLTVKLEVPVAVGVPEMAPVEAVRVSPAGRLPDVIVHV